jgi:hypothetical protein
MLRAGAQGERYREFLAAALRNYAEEHKKVKDEG